MPNEPLYQFYETLPLPPPLPPACAPPSPGHVRTGPPGQCSTVQYSTVHYSTVQHSTLHLVVVLHGGGEGLHQVVDVATRDVLTKPPLESSQSHRVISVLCKMHLG